MLTCGSIFASELDQPERTTSHNDVTKLEHPTLADFERFKAETVAGLKKMQDELNQIKFTLVRFALVGFATELNNFENRAQAIENRLNKQSNT